MALIAMVQVLALGVWFSASAVVPTLRTEWGISSIEAVWLTASVQVGFAVGALASAFLNLADRIRPHLLLAASAGAAALTTGALALLVGDFAAALPLRVLTGIFLAGVYPVGMKLVASWSQPARRGKSMGLLLGALTLGSSFPHLISGLGSLNWKVVLGSAALVSGTGAAVALIWVRPGPYLHAGMARPSPRYIVELFRHSTPRLINFGYFGHMWELYAVWTWLPSFMVASELVHGNTLGNGLSLGAFLAIGVAGVGGCLIGGWLADRFGPPLAAGGALLISGTCCLISPLLFGLPWIILMGFCIVWGASVIADSGVFSAALSESVDHQYTGSALTIQTAIGFSLTVAPIQIVPLAADMLGWQFAFLLLAPGPLLGALAMMALRARNAALRPRTDNSCAANDSAIDQSFWEHRL
ncbi:MFS transporter [Arthrobacter sp. NicSoilB8]|nr:MFS transporter [Arthrobacter sp. NicSoilB8]